MAKTLFAIELHSIIDVITNSSSELFVTRGNKEEFEKLLKEKYPLYLNEYEPLKCGKELTEGQKEMFPWYRVPYYEDALYLLSIFDNPSFDMQEVLEYELMMKRYHLG